MLSGDTVTRQKSNRSASKLKSGLDSRDEHTLALPALAHADPRPLGDRKDVRAILLLPAVAVRVDRSLSVDGKGAVGVDGDEEDAWW